MQDQQRIEEALRQHPEGLSLDQLTDMLQLPKDLIAFHLGYMRGKEKKVFVIQWAGINNVGKTCNLYKLTETES